MCCTTTQNGHFYVFRSNDVRDIKKKYSFWPIIYSSNAFSHFLKKWLKKKGQDPIVNNGTNVTSHARRWREGKKVLSKCCVFQSEWPPDEISTKRRKCLGAPSLVKNWSEWHFWKRRKNAMYIIPYKNLYKVHFGSGRKFQENGFFFRPSPAGPPPAGQHRIESS